MEDIESMSQLVNTITMFIKKRPMSNEEIISELDGICEESQVRHAIKEMAEEGLIHYDPERKIHLVK